MWTRVAQELQMPWRTVEAMHWIIGRTGMAHRAGQEPFELLESARLPNT